MFKTLNLRLKNSHKNAKKIISIFFVILLLFNIFTITVLSSETKNKPVKDLKEKIINTKNKIKQIKQLIYETINKINGKIKQKQNTQINSVKTLKNTLSNKNLIFSYFQTYLGLKSSSSKLFLYTNYSGIEKETKINIFQTLRIDVNNDGVNDISAQLILYPSIELSKGFSINSRLKINILKLPKAFPDKKTKFESYIEMEFPGFLKSEWKEDRVRFGFKSEENEVIPDSCITTYKFIPNLLRSNEKPRHKVELIQDSITGANSLSTIFRYAQINNGTIEEFNNLELKYTPAVKKSEMCVYRCDEHVGLCLSLNLFGDKTFADIYVTKEKMGESSEIGILIDKLSSFTFTIDLTPLTKGGGKIEYQRISKDEVDITIYKKDISEFYSYIEGLPNHIVFSWQPGLIGGIQLDCFNESIAAVGLRDSIKDSDVTFDVFVANLPSIAKLNWSIKPICKHNVSFSIMSDVYDCIAYIYSKDLMTTGVTLEADIRSRSIIDCMLFWNFSSHVLRFTRVGSDIELNANMFDQNGNSYDFSGNIKTIVDDYFEIDFGPLFNHETSITLMGGALDISYLSAELNLVEYGTFYVDMAKLIKDRHGFIKTCFSLFEDGDIYNFNCSIEIYKGLQIYDLVLGWDDFSYPVGDIIETRDHAIHRFGVALENATVQWDVANDLSWGNIYISGGISLSFNSEYRRAGEVCAFIKGNVYFESEDAGLLISWNKVGNETNVSIDGTFVLSLSGFEFWVEEKIHVEVPDIYGKFQLNSYSKNWSMFLFIEDGAALFDLDLGRLSLVDVKNMTIQVSIDVYLYGGMSGYLMLSGNDSGVLFVDGFFDANVEAVLEITDLYFSNYHGGVDGGGFSVRIDEITVQGKIDFNINFTDKSITLDSFYASLFIRDFEFRSTGEAFGFMVISFFILEIEGGGTLTITNDTIDLLIATFSILLVDLSADIDGFGFITCEEIYLELSDITPGKTIIYNGRTYIRTWHQATLEKFLIKNLIMTLPEQNESKAIYLEMTLLIRGPIIIQTDFGMKPPGTPDPDLWSVLRLEMEEYCSFSIADFLLNINYGETIVKWESFFVEGRGVIYLHENGHKDEFTPDNLYLLHVKGDIKTVNWLGFYAKTSTPYQDKSLTITGQFDFRFSGPLKVEFRIAGSNHHPEILVILGLESGSIDISDVQVSISSTNQSDGSSIMVSAGWDHLHIGVRGQGRFELNHQKGPDGYSTYHELYATASLDSLILDRLWAKGDDGKKFEISGSLNLNFAGPFTVTIEKSTFSPWHLNFLLNSGSLSISDLEVDYNYGEVHGSWDDLTIEGSFEVDVIATSSSGGLQSSGLLGPDTPVTSSSLSIDAVGSGSVNLDMMRITSTVGIINAGVDHLSMDVFAETSVYIYKDFTNEAKLRVKGRGSVSNIVIDNLYAQLNLGVGDLFIVEEADIDFSGTGELNADFSYPGSFSLSGGISGSNVHVHIDHLALEIPDFVFIDMYNFDISGDTTFSLDCHGFSNTIFTEVNILVGINSQWSIDSFTLGAYDLNIVRIDGITGNGEIRLGVHNFVEDSFIPEFFVLGFDGTFNWDNLNIAPGVGIMPEYLKTIGGSLNGNADIEIYFPMLWYSNFQELYINGEVYENTIVNFGQIEFVKGYISFSDLTLNPGSFSFSWDIPIFNQYNDDPSSIGHIEIDTSGTVNLNIDFLKVVVYDINLDVSLISLNVKVPHLFIGWDLNRNGTEELFINTNNQVCILDCLIVGRLDFNVITMQADDFHVWWNYDSDKIFKDIDWDGTIDISVGKINVNIDGQWHSLDLSGNNNGNDIIVDHGGPYEGEAGENIEFSGSASGGTPPYEYTWLIEDTVNGDQVLNGQTVYYDGFTQIGEYNVYLNVEDSIGNSEYVDTTVNVVMPHDNQPPKAILNAIEYYGNDGESVYFDGSASYDPDGNITQWRWEYGDGTSEESSFMPIANHEYDSPGAYNLKLWVYDDWGVRRYDTAIVFVENSSNQPPEVFIYVVNKDTGAYIGSSGFSPNGENHIYGGVVEQLYTFKPNHFGRESTNDPDGSIYQYKWEIYNAVCFAGGTKISMADGSFKNIEDVVVGDLVKTFDEENKVITSAKVTSLYHHTLDEMKDYYLIINDLLRVTTDHMIYVNGEWKSAGDIQIGDTLQDIYGNEIIVESIEKVYEKIATYNFDVETYHTFYADGILVHNEKDVPNTTWRSGYPNSINMKRKSAGTITAILHVRDNEGVESTATVYFHVDDQEPDN